MAIKKNTKVEGVEVNVPDTTPTKENTVEVNTDAITSSVRKEGNVRIRMREDHRCFIGGSRYNLIKGHTYDVPENVKTILDKRGLLAPLM